MYSRLPYSNLFKNKMYWACYNTHTLEIEALVCKLVKEKDEPSRTKRNAVAGARHVVVRLRGDGRSLADV